MNYYIQGNKEKADQIKTAFEAKGFIPRIAPMYYGSESVLFFTGTDNYIYETPSPWVMDIIKTHPDFQELELHVQPKFKVGDWIVATGKCVYLITKIDEFTVILVDVMGDKYEFGADLLNDATLWTVNDAKDGDVITNGKLIVIFNKLEEPAYKQHIIAYVGLDLCGRLQITEDTWQLGVDNAMPATKEQRDLLFKKMKEAGYQWDEKKKELRKIKPHYDIKNFYAGMPVLVRETSLNAWQYVLFSHCYIGGDGLTRFNAGLVGFTQCIPFNNDTKHLLGITDMPSEEYINW